MRIVVNGRQAFGKAVLEALLGRGDDVAGVYAAPDAPDGRTDPLAEAAAAAGLPLFQPATYRDPDVHDQFRALAPDLQIMAFVTLVIPQSFLNVPTHGTIQYHPSVLPRHRGRSAINWPIISGETETGLTVFWPDAGLDTGDVLLWKTTPIGPDETLGTVYFERLFPMGVEALLEAVDMVKADEAPRYPQDDALATYEGPCEHGSARVDWSRPWRQIHDLVRGCDPQPGAWTSFGDAVVRLYGTAPQPARDLAGLGGAPGEIVEVGPDGVTVACADGRIRVARVRLAGGAKLPADEWAAQAGLMPGARLG
jgi:methionyl-tRNA formyltransferase